MPQFIIKSHPQTSPTQVVAARTGDFSEVKDFVGALAADQFAWIGLADRACEVSEVLEISVAQ